MAQTHKSNWMTAKTIPPSQHGRELSCSQLVSWAMATAVACLLANWMVLSL